MANKELKVKDSKQPKLDGLKWTVIVLLIAAGVAANYYFDKVPVPILLIGWLILACIVGGIAAFTAKGRMAITFAKEARVELRKVVWPNRQETVQTTMIVIFAVVVVALILWGIDSFLLWSIGMLTGHRG